MHIAERATVAGSLLSEVRLAEATILNEFIDCARDGTFIVSKEAPRVEASDDAMSSRMFTDARARAVSPRSPNRVADQGGCR